MQMKMEILLFENKNKKKFLVEVEEKAKNLSEIGGIVALFLVVSIISVLEFFYFFY